VEWLDGHYEEFVNSHAVQVAHRFGGLKYVESVDVVNMHEVVRDGNVIDDLFGNRLDAKTACQAINDGAKASKANIGIDHDYQRLAIKASFAGKLSNKVKGKGLNRIAKKLANQTKEMELPKVCPPTELLERIFQAEVEHEKALFPAWFESQGREEGLRQSFDAAVEKKFCCLDVAKIFESGVMDSLFE